jgi:drug/metabolite transporter (DMT)-like permease
LCWAVSAALGKAAFSGRAIAGGHALAPLDPQILSQTRTSISFLILAPLLVALRGKRALAMPRRDLLRCLLLGVLGLAASNFLYYYAIAKGSVSVAIIVQYTAPVWVLLYMVASGREHVTSVKIGSIIAALLGIALAIGIVGQHGLELHWIAVAAALGAAFSFSFYNIYARGLLRAHSRWKVMTYAMLGSAIFWIIVNPPSRIVAAHYDRAQWIFMVVFALSSMLIPFAFYFSGLHHLDPTRAIVTSCLEPAFTVLIAGMFLGEHFGAMQAIGMALVLGASIAIQIQEQPGSEHTDPQVAV